MSEERTKLIQDNHIQDSCFVDDSVDGALSQISSTSPTFRDLVFWDTTDALNLTSVDSCEHGVYKMEAYFYYYGIRGKGILGPRLIYRTSKDIFSIPSNPSQDLRLMELLTVGNHDKPSKEDIRRNVFDDTCDILDCKNIIWSTVEIVRFQWKEMSKDSNSTKTVASPVNIWIGVHPNGANGDTAFSASQAILKHMKEYLDIDDIDIGFHQD